jgi:hypothetical protein
MLSSNYSPQYLSQSNVDKLTQKHGHKCL